MTQIPGIKFTHIDKKLVQSVYLCSRNMLIFYANMYNMTFRYIVFIFSIVLIGCFQSIEGKANSIDSLYLSFTGAKGNDYLKNANQIAQYTGDTVVYTTKMTMDEIHAQILKNIMIYYSDREKYRDVLRYAEKGVNFYHSIQDSFNMAGCFHTVAIACQRLGLYEEAIENYYRSKDILTAMDENPRSFRIRYMMNNMAEIYKIIKQYGQSETLYLQCLDMIEGKKPVDMKDRATYLANLSELYVEEVEGLSTQEASEKLNKALSYAIEALNLSRQYNETEEKIVYRLTTLSNAYIAKEQYQQADLLLQEALKLSQQHNFQYRITLIYAYKGIIAIETSHPKEAEIYFDRAEAMAREQNNQELIRLINQIAYKYFRKHNAEKALEYLEKSSFLKDSILTKNMQELLSDYRARYEMAEKEHQIVIHKAELRRKNQQQWVLLVVIALCLLILFIVDRYRRLVRRRNRELYEMNRTKDRLFSIISHDLKSPVMAQKRAVDGLLHKLDELSTDELKTNLYDFQHATEAELDLLQNLLSWARMQTGQMKPAPIVFDMNETVAEVARIYRMPAQYKQINLRLQTAEKCEAFADRNMIQAVLRNMLHNAIKFSHPDSEIIITTKCLEESVRVSVKDSGVGMKPEQIDAILKNRTFRSTAGTNDEKGSGLGLLICKEMLERNGSELIIRSEHGQGTEVEFELHK